MLKPLLASTCLLLAACDARPIQGIELKSFVSLSSTGADAPRRVGDRVDLVGLAAGDTGTLTLTNTFNHLSKTTSFDAATRSLVLDASTLPGFRADAKVQEFEVEIKTGSRSSRPPSLFVVTEADVQPFPHPFTQLGGGAPANVDPGQPVTPVVGPGPRSWQAMNSTSGPEAYVQKLIGQWQLATPTITHADVPRAEVQLPDWLKTAPDSTTFVRYELTSTFPKYLVPKEYSASGQPDVYTPTKISILLTQTDPADLVSLTAK